MRVLKGFLVVSTMLAACPLAATTGTTADIMALAGGTGDQRFFAVKELSDGTILFGGVSADLAWLPAGITMTTLTPNPSELINNNGTNVTPFLLHVSNDLGSIIAAYQLPRGSAEDIRFIRTDTIPGTTTGNIYISGRNRAVATRDNGYFVAKLNGNFVAAAPTGIEWATTIWAERGHEDIQPWDVDSQGRIVYATGGANGVNWVAVHRWNPVTRRNDVIPGFRQHWMGPDPNTLSEFRGNPADAPQTVQHSGLVLKERNRGNLRSWNEEDFSSWFPDGNGGWRRGKYPADLFFAVPFNPNDPNSSANHQTPGYTGYRLADNSNTTGRVGGIAVDKRNDHFYIGFCFKTVLPGGNPDFEPAVMAFDSDGNMKWWNRLWREYTGTPPNGTTNLSTPDQYVDGLAVDYSLPATSGALVVLGRSHGNNVVNLWDGNSVANWPSNPGFSFHNRFTGTNGNIHISWLGKFGLQDGTLRYATWVAEYNNQTTGLGAAYSDPNLDGWPSHNAGWPNLNTTRMRPTLHVDLDGRVYLIGSAGRRTITTANAFMKMPKFTEGESKWNNFVRVFSADFTTLVYSSLVTGEWDITNANGPNNVQVHGIFPTANGLLLAGWHQTDGGALPLRNVPAAWGHSVIDGETPVFGRLLFSEPAEPPANVPDWSTLH